MIHSDSNYRPIYQRANNYRFISPQTTNLYKYIEEEILQPWWNDGSLNESKYTFQKLTKSLDKYKNNKSIFLGEFIWQKLHTYPFMQYSIHYQNLLKNKILRCAKIFKQSGDISKAVFEVIKQKFEKKSIEDYMVDFLIHSNKVPTSQGKEEEYSKQTIQKECLPQREQFKRQPLQHCTYQYKSTLLNIWRRYIFSDFLDTWEYILNFGIKTQIIYSTILRVTPVILSMPSNHPTHHIALRTTKLYHELNRSKRYQPHFDPIEFILQKNINNYSVFFSPGRVKGATVQIKFIEELLKSAQQDLQFQYGVTNYAYELIGSYSNQLALEYESSIDYVLKFNGGKIKQVKTVDILGSLSAAILRRVYNTDNKPADQFTFELEAGIVPFLKIKYKNKRYFATCFHIYINQTNSIHSTNIVALYTSNPYIKKLCILLKIWARRKYNSIDKSINGYIITVMTLYYLIHTKQVTGIIQAEQGFTVEQGPWFGQPITLYENFKACLVFYLQIKNQQNFYELNLTNGEKKMYNPCRLRVRLSNEFFRVAKLGLEELNSCNDLDDLFKYPKGDK